MNSFLNMNNSNAILGNNNPVVNTSWLTKIQTAGGALNTSTLLLIIATILFILVGVSYYYFYIIPSTNAMYRANSEQVSSASKGDSSEAELLFFYADWCPHCKQAKPIWDEMKTHNANKPVNGYNVIFTEIDCSTENAQVEKMMDKYNVEGFPTIKLLKNGQVIEYDAKPSKDTLAQFLNTVLT
jgi:thiol-disulfide isomerase/thioredoxin